MSEITTPSFLTEPQPKDRSGFSPFALFLIGLMIVAFVVIGIALYQQKQTQPDSGPAPDFTVTTYDGDSISLSSLKGNIVVINFWASWCGPCRAEAPSLQRIYEDYKDRGVVFLGINWAEKSTKALEYIDEYNITYLNAPDTGTRISEDYNIQGVPETFIIDQNGEVVEFFYYLDRDEQLTSILDRLLVAQ